MKLVLQGFFQGGSIILSILAYYGANLLISTLCVTCSHPAQPHYVVFHTMQDPRHWLAVMLSIILALLPQ